MNLIIKTSNKDNDKDPDEESNMEFLGKLV